MIKLLTSKDIVISSRSRTASDRDSYQYEIDVKYIKYHIGLHSYLNPKNSNYHEAIMHMYEVKQVVSEFIDEYC